MKNRYSPQTLSAMLLVTGTCIGGGMLALPVATAPAGFIPSTCVMFFAWLAMTCSALYFIEAGFWMKKEDAHVISMAERFLKTPGKTVSWVVYLFICYASLVAYTAGSGHMFMHALNKALNTHFSREWGCILFTLIFGPLLYLKHTTLGKINSWLVAAMIVAYVLLIGLSAPSVHSELLTTSRWGYSLACLPLLLTAFSFQTMVPSLHSYLQHDKRSLRVAIIGGTSFAFIVYLVWQIVVLGTVPFAGSFGLQEALKQGEPATHFLGMQVGNAWVEICANFFAFFALVTSYLGIGLGLFDFLSDGLKIPKKGTGALLLTALIIIPVLFSSTLLERVFLLALDLSGGFGDTILNGMIPVLMVWVGRYVMHLGKSATTVPGGKWALVLTFAFFFATLLIEVALRTDCVHLAYNPTDINLTQEAGEL